MSRLTYALCGTLLPECIACDWNNATQGFKVPVFGILCDGKSFEFFSFDGGTSPPSLTRGCLPGDPLEFRRGLRLSDFTLTGPTHFIHELRQICEVIFDLLMSSFVSSLTEFQKRSDRRGKRDQKPRKSLAKWDEALNHAKDASGKFRDAEAMRKNQLVDEANETVEEAMKALKQRYEILMLLIVIVTYLLYSSVELVPIDRTDLVMTGWVDADVEKA